MREVEDRYTSFDGNSVTKQEGDIFFGRDKATGEGEQKLRSLPPVPGRKRSDFKIRTGGTAELEIIGGIDDVITLPDTKGQWRYVTYTMNDFQFFGDLAYLKVKGAGTTVDIDHINVNAGAQSDASGV